MTRLEIFAQLIGIVAMVLNILSFQFKNQKTIIFIQLMVAALFSANFILLGAVVGGILNFIGILRAVVFVNKDKLHCDSKAWLFIFVTLYLVSFAISFTVFDMQPTIYNLIIQILPVVGETALTVGFSLKTSAQTRKCALVSSPTWLIYNVIVGSWGAIICEVFTLFSVILGMIRHDTSNKHETH